VVVPDNVVDIPTDGMKQFGERRDRINDVTQSQHNLQQQELQRMEANIEASSEDEANQAEMKDEERVQKKLEKRKADKTKKRKQAEKTHDVDVDAELREEERLAQMEEEIDPPDIQEMKMFAKKPKTRAKQIANQTYEKGELRPARITNSDARAARMQKRQEAARLADESTRTKLTKARAKLAGDPPEEMRTTLLWMNLAPRRKAMLSNELERVWKEDHERARHRRLVEQAERMNVGVMYNHVTPERRRETQVRLSASAMSTSDTFENEDWMTYGSDQVETPDDDVKENESLLSDEDEDVIIETNALAETVDPLEGIREVISDVGHAVPVDHDDGLNKYHEGIWTQDRLAEELIHHTPARRRRQEEPITILSSRSQALTNRRSALSSFSSGKVFYQRMLNNRGFPDANRVSSDEEE
jgi:hypothetical protein